VDDYAHADRWIPSRLLVSGLADGSNRAWCPPGTSGGRVLMSSITNSADGSGRAGPKR
jgi:hypothetical protein